MNEFSEEEKKSINLKENLKKRKDRDLNLSLHTE